MIQHQICLSLIHLRWAPKVTLMVTEGVLPFQDIFTTCDSRHGFVK